MFKSNQVPRVTPRHAAFAETPGRGRLASGGAGGGILAGRRILAVHDSPEITSVLVDVFAAAGARVAVAHEGPDANMLIGWGGHDLVFLDAAVPGAMDVLELIAECRPELLRRTIVLTGDVRDSYTLARMRTSYMAALFFDSWLVDLVGVAARVVGASERRAVA